MTLPTNYVDGQNIHGSDFNATNTAVNASTDLLDGTTPGATLTRPTIKGYVENQVALGVVGSTAALVATNGTQLTATLTSGIVTSFSMPTPAAGLGFTLILTQAAAGNGGAVFPAVIWNTLGAPTVTPAGGYIDIFVFVSDGINWYGSYSQGFGTGILTNVYLADGASPSAVGVYELASDATQTTLGFTGLSAPSGVAVDSSGAVYVSDYNHNAVYKLSGGVQSTLPFTGLTNPQGIAIDSAGTVYVANTGLSQVVKLTSSGAQSTLPFSGISNVNDVAVDSSGAVYVSQTTPGVVYKLAGTAQTTVPFFGLSSAGGITVDSEGAVYVIDFAAPAVRKLYGGIQTTLGFTGLVLPTAVEVDAAGGVYVADQSALAVFRLTGGVQTTLPYTGLAKPQFLAVTVA